MPSFRTSLSSFARRVSSILVKKSKSMYGKGNKGTYSTAPPATTGAENASMQLTEVVVCSLLGFAPLPSTPAPRPRPTQSSSTRTAPSSAAIPLTRTKASQPGPRAASLRPSQPPHPTKRHKVPSGPPSPYAAAVCIDLALPIAITFAPIAASSPESEAEDASDMPVFIALPRRRSTHRRSHSALSTSSTSSYSSDNLRRKVLRRTAEESEAERSRKEAEQLFAGLDELEMLFAEAVARFGPY
ncbi:hypothetical protein JCM10207_004247 [Rhodosporidiobolus poonsookiae]